MLRFISQIEISLTKYSGKSTLSRFNGCAFWGWKYIIMVGFRRAFISQANDIRAVSFRQKLHRKGGFSFHLLLVALVRFSFGFKMWNKSNPQRLGWNSSDSTIQQTELKRVCEASFRDDQVELPRLQTRLLQPDLTSAWPYTIPFPACLKMVAFAGLHAPAL